MVDTRQTQTIGPDEILTTAELSDFLHVPVDTLYEWRKRGYGPPAARVGKHLRYRRSTVLAWLDAQTAASHVAS